MDKRVETCGQGSGYLVGSHSHGGEQFLKIIGEWCLKNKKRLAGKALVFVGLIGWLIGCRSRVLSN